MTILDLDWWLIVALLLLLAAWLFVGSRVFNCFRLHWVGVILILMMLLVASFGCLYMWCYCIRSV
jgi:hypothetical protein